MLLSVVSTAAVGPSELITKLVPADTVPTLKVPIPVLPFNPQWVSLYTQVALGVQAAALLTVYVPDERVAFPNASVPGTSDTLPVGAPVLPESVEGSAMMPVPMYTFVK